MYLVQEVSTWYCPCNSEGHGGKSRKGGAKEISQIGCRSEGTTAWVSMGSSCSSNSARLVFVAVVGYIAH